MPGFSVKELMSASGSAVEILKQSVEDTNNRNQFNGSGDFLAHRHPPRNPPEISFGGCLTEIVNVTSADLSSTVEAAKALVEDTSVLELGRMRLLLNALLGSDETAAGPTPSSILRIAKLPCEGSPTECFLMPTLSNSPNADETALLRTCKSAWAFVRLMASEEHGLRNQHLDEKMKSLASLLEDHLSPLLHKRQAVPCSFETVKNKAHFSDANFPLGPFRQNRKPKRIRTAFSPSQLLRLENAFETNHYVVGQERKKLAESLSLTETQVRYSVVSHGLYTDACSVLFSTIPFASVPYSITIQEEVKVWFQNRRTKFKRVRTEVQDSGGSNVEVMQPMAVGTKVAFSKKNPNITTSEAVDEKSFQVECLPMSTCKVGNFPFSHSSVDASFSPSGLQFPPPKPECSARIKPTGNTTATTFKSTFKVPTSMFFTSLSSLHPTVSSMPKAADHQVPKCESIYLPQVKKAMTGKSAAQSWKSAAHALRSPTASAAIIGHLKIHSRAPKVAESRRISRSDLTIAGFSCTSNREKNVAEDIPVESTEYISELAETIALYCPNSLTGGDVIRGKTSQWEITDSSLTRSGFCILPRVHALPKPKEHAVRKF
ncbi:unnamed protein product [Schistocephalus solidus]|uniref:Homeobox domain-containing protein n=1 Tax=Schistocephalus solidus TaxID=70667 RepID=A0A183TC72_SCHSO|nr:unnamed protein product [Schistocephalus solidus]